MADKYLKEDASGGYQLEDGSGILLLEGLDAAPVGAGQYVAANAPGPRYKQRGYVDVLPNILIATLTLVAVVRGPVIIGAGYSPPVHRDPFEAPNMLALNGTVAAPFVNEPQVEGRLRQQRGDTLQGGLTAQALQPPLTQDLNVDGKRYSVHFDTQPLVNLQSTTLATDALSSLRAQPDWNATRFRQRNDLAPQQNLQTNTLQPPAPVPFALYDWPTSRKPTGKYIGDAPTLQATTLATDALSSLRAQPDWTGTRYRQRNDLAPQQNLMATTLAPVAAVPFSTPNWTGYKRPLRGDAQAPDQLLPLFAPAGGKPFTNPNFDGRRKRPIGAIFYPPRLRGEDGPPPPPAARPQPTQDAFAVNKQRPRRDDLQPLNLLTSTLYIAGLMPDLYPEPTLRKRKGHSYQDTNRLPLSLSLIPNLQPRPLPNLPEGRIRVRPFSTEADTLLPIPLVPAASPFFSRLLPEGKIIKRYDSLQPIYPLTCLFQQLDGPFPQWDFEGRNRKIRAALEPIATNLPLLSAINTLPFSIEPIENRRRPPGKQIELQQLGSARVLLATASKPFVYPSWPEGHGYAALRSQYNVPDPINLTINLPTGPIEPPPDEPPTGVTPRTEAMEEYSPTNILADPAAQRELQRVSQVLQQFNTKGVRVSHIPPEKPNDGQMQIADGNDWDPLGDGTKQPVWYDSATQQWKPFSSTYKRTEAEILLDIIPSNTLVPEGYVIRYSDDYDPGVSEDTVAIQTAINVMGIKNGGDVILELLHRFTGTLIFDKHCVRMYCPAGAARNTSIGAGGRLLHDGVAGQTAIKTTGTTLGLMFGGFRLENIGASDRGIWLHNAQNFNAKNVYVREFRVENWLQECDGTASSIYNNFEDIAGFTANGAFIQTAIGFRQVEGPAKAVNNNKFTQTNFGNNLVGFQQDSECHENAFDVIEVGGCKTGLILRGRTHFVAANLEGCDVVALAIVAGSAASISGSIHFGSNTLDVDNPGDFPIFASMHGGDSGNSVSISPRNTAIAMRGQPMPVTGGIAFSTADGDPVLNRNTVTHMQFASGITKLPQNVELSTGKRIDLKDGQTTVGAAGGASALPATPVVYVKIKVDGVEIVIPGYNA